MSPELDRKSRRALYWVIGFAIVTVLLVAMGALQWMKAPVPLTMGVLLDLPIGASEFFVGGKPMGSSTILLNDADLLSLSEESLVSEAWPPPGHTSGATWVSMKMQVSDFLVPPLVVGGDFVWQCRIVNGGKEKRLALRLRAVDGQGQPLEAWRDSSMSQGRLGLFEAHTSHCVSFGPHTIGR